MTTKPQVPPVDAPVEEQRRFGGRAALHILERRILERGTREMSVGWVLNELQHMANIELADKHNPGWIFPEKKYDA